MALSKSFRGSSEGLVTQDLLGGKNTSRGRAEVSEDVLGFIVNQLTDAYVDPLQAALREVVSNAVDATAMAGKRTPVKITLPSPLSPNLVVEDFGTGMSLDQVKTNYVMYGSSTKVNNFEQIGAESTRKAIGSLRAKNVARGDIAGPGRLKASPSASSKSHHDWWRTGEDQAWRTFEVVS